MTAPSFREMERPDGLHRAPTTEGHLGSRNRFSPTRAGWVFLALLPAVAMAALNTGNNLLYLVLSLLCALLLLNNLLGEWNLRNLVISRRLPPEAFAEQSAAGSLTVGNRRRLLAAFSLHLREVTGNAEAFYSSISPGEQQEIKVHYRFHERGWTHLAQITVSSTFPFGLLRRWQRVELIADALVYPRPETAPHSSDTRLTGSTYEDEHRVGASGQFRGLRTYQAGDPLHHIHWPTTARTGDVMIVLRDGEADALAMVELRPARDAVEWEREIRRACGQVEHHFRLGRAVGLKVGETLWPPRAGEDHRQRLLTGLALLSPHAPQRPLSSPQDTQPPGPSPRGEGSA